MYSDFWFARVPRVSSHRFQLFQTVVNSHWIGPHTASPVTSDVIVAGLTGSLLDRRWQNPPTNGFQQITPSTPSRAL